MGQYEHQRRKQWTKSSSSLTLYQCFYNEQLYTMLDQAAESSDAYSEGCLYSCFFLLIIFFPEDA